MYFRFGLFNSINTYLNRPINAEIAILTPLFSSVIAVIEG